MALILSSSEASLRDRSVAFQNIRKKKEQTWGYIQNELAGQRYQYLGKIIKRGTGRIRIDVRHGNCDFIFISGPGGSLKFSIITHISRNVLNETVYWQIEMRQ